jgi:hypothetical protein
MNCFAEILGVHLNTHDQHGIRPCSTATVHGFTFATTGYTVAKLHRLSCCDFTVAGFAVVNLNFTLPRPTPTPLKTS